MALKEQLNLLVKEFSTLKEKLKRKLATDKETLTEKTNQLNESNRKLEEQIKENSENEQVLETLLKEFKELEEELN